MHQWTTCQLSSGRAQIYTAYIQAFLLPIFLFSGSLLSTSSPFSLHQFFCSCSPSAGASQSSHHVLHLAINYNFCHSLFSLKFGPFLLLSLFSLQLSLFLSLSFFPLTPWFLAHRLCLVTFSFLLRFITQTDCEREREERRESERNMKREKERERVAKVKKGWREGKQQWKQRKTNG